MNHLVAIGGDKTPFTIDGREAGYCLTFPNNQYLYVLGKYTCECGGLDSSFSYKGAADDVMRLVSELAEHGHVVCEGVVAMSSYGFGRLSRFAIDQES